MVRIDASESIIRRTIPETYKGNKVTMITERSLNGLDIMYIEIPETVTEIHKNALSDNGLEEISLPSKLKYIGSYAFENNLIVNLDLPDSLEFCALRSFSGNHTLRNVSFKDPGIERNPFTPNYGIRFETRGSKYDCGSENDHILKKDNGLLIAGNKYGTIPEEASELGASCFYDLRQEEFYVPHHVHTIHRDVIEDSDMVKKVYLPPHLISIDDDAFEGLEDQITIISDPGSLVESYAKRNGFKFQASGYPVIKDNSKTAPTKIKGSNLFGKS